MEDKHYYNQDLMTFIDESPTSWHVIKRVVNRLKEKGFHQLMPGQRWRDERGEGIYFLNGDSSLLACRLGTKPGFRIIAAHSDAPGLRIKPKATMRQSGFVRLAVEAYGGLIISSWMDRPLTLAGRVFCHGTHPFAPEIREIFYRRPFAIIPNCCIHFNRNLNSGYEWNLQKDMQPVYALPTQERDFSALIADEIGCGEEDILSWDLSLVPTEKSISLGPDEQLISAPRLDNLGMVHAALSAFLAASPAEESQILLLCDHEEVGSGSRLGATAATWRDVLERLSLLVDAGTDAFYRGLASSLMISADQAHASHPNYPEKEDPLNAPLVNKGPVIKGAASLAYATDGYSSAMIRALAMESGIAIQEFRNRADIRGGATLGPLLSRHLNIPTADIGNPILAMHSARELAGTEDQWQMIRLMTHFYQR